MSYRQWEIAETELSDVQRAGLAYWRSLPVYAATRMPLKSSFDLMQIPGQILPTTHVVDVLDAGRAFRYRFWGSGFRAYLGYDGTGMSTDDLMPLEIREPVRKAYLDVMLARRPLAMLSEFARGDIKPRQGFQRFIRFPLTDEDGNVAQVVSLVEFLMDYHDAQKLIEALGNDDE
ncbi:MAG: hypothetical protein JJ900_13415 [Rhodospirillales bacterium]|nr:hypothetical protein [Rhodospirillales bacterium]MBO6787843.1 hypothetical protein [Rhodospirillales bacterium]